MIVYSAITFKGQLHLKDVNLLPLIITLQDNK